MLRKNCRIAFFIPHLHGGGMERITINLIKEFITLDYMVDLILINESSCILKKEIPGKCRIINLRAKRALTSIIPLARYLKKERPNLLITAVSHVNIIALLTVFLFRIPIPIIITEHGTFSAAFAYEKKWYISKFFSLLMCWFYPKAQFVVGVSQGVIEDLRKVLGYPNLTFRVIYNPIVDDKLFKSAQEPLDHPWFREGEPSVVLAVGRLSVEKDFPTLLEAFVLLRKRIRAHLVILGEGDKRKELEEMAEILGIREDVDFPGFVENPYKYMKKAKVLALSSVWEGLPTVLVEAMALGTPVVSTNCPSGPKEILDDGKYGFLVPVKDPEKMSEAIFRILTDRNLARELSRKVTERAKKFSVEKAVEEYLELINDILK